MADQSRQKALGAGSPDAVRSEIEQTRARMSETIDEIEVVLLKKKEDLKDRLDVFRKVRERPLAAVGAAIGAGLLLGLLTGGKKKAPQPVVIAAPHPRHPDVWEMRARRLMQIARQQQQELEELREGGEWEEVED